MQLPKYSSCIELKTSGNNWHIAKLSSNRQFQFQLNWVSLNITLCNRPATRPAGQPTSRPAGHPSEYPKDYISPTLSFRINCKQIFYSYCWLKSNQELEGKFDSLTNWRGPQFLENRNFPNLLKLVDSLSFLNQRWAHFFFIMETTFYFLGKRGTNYILINDNIN